MLQIFGCVIDVPNNMVYFGYGRNQFLGIVNTKVSDFVASIDSNCEKLFRQMTAKNDEVQDKQPILDLLRILADVFTWDGD